MRMLSWFAVAVMATLLGCGGGATPEDDGKVRIVATLPPLAWPAETLLGDRAEVTVLVPPGASPHGFELAPSGAAALHAADLILIAGGADAWALQRLDPGDERVLGMEAGGDHHPWLDPDAYAAFARRVGQTPAVRAAADAAPKGSLATGLAIVEAARESAASAADGAAVLAITGHDAWSAFFASIGVDDVIAVRRGHAGEPAASTLLSVRERAARADAALVVLEAGEEAAWLESLAREIGAAVTTLDPVGTRDWPADMVRRYEAVQAGLESLR